MEGFKDDQNKSKQQTSLAKKVTGKEKGTINQCYKKWLYTLGIFGGTINILDLILIRILKVLQLKFYKL